MNSKQLAALSSIDINDENGHLRAKAKILQRPRIALDEIGNQPDTRTRDTLKSDLTEKQLKETSKRLPQINNIDSSDDPLLAGEYAVDMYCHLKKLEKKYSIEKDFLTDHKTSVKMRCMLLNWIVEVQLSFSLLLETLQLTITIVDRYLTVNKTIGRSNLQLVGVSALLIASKYEEIYPPLVQDLVDICDNAFTRDEILEMEREILKALHFNLEQPVSIIFLRRYSRVAEVSAKQYNLAKFLSELASIDYEMCHYVPSMQAAASICLSVAILKKAVNIADVWNHNLIHYSGYKYEDIKLVVVKLACILGKRTDSKYEGIYSKYLKAKFGEISSNPELDGILTKRLIRQSSILLK